MKIQNTKLFVNFVFTILTFPLLTGCGGENTSASKEISVCTTYSSEIAEAEEMQGGLMELNRLTGGSETQISPTPFEIGGWAFGLAETFRSEGIVYESGLANKGAVEKFLEVAGECLSADTYQYFLNYID